MIVPHWICSVMSAAAFAMAMSSSAATLRSEAPYLSENDIAMKKMMAGMAVRPTGDVDRDFVNMMVRHHQGAIDMAMAVLRHGRDEKVRRWRRRSSWTSRRRLAMRLAVGEKLPASKPSPTQPVPAMPDDMNMK